MSNVVIEGWAGVNQVIYGLGAGGENIFMVPARGLITGGDQFVIIGSGVSNASHVDKFTAASLDTTKWTNISTGGGSLTTGAGLKLAVTPAGGTAGVRTVTQYKNFDVVATFFYDNAIEKLFPASEITFLRLTARIDANNNFSVAHVWDPTRGSVIRASITVDGTTTILSTDVVKSSSRSLRLVRFDGRIQARVGESQLLDFSGWSDALVNIEMATTGPALPLPLSTTVTSYTPNVLVTLGKEICPFAFEVVNRIIGTVPATKLTGLVEVQVHGIGTSVSLGKKSFEYFAPLQLTLTSNDSSIIISNDNTLRDSSAELRGLRL